ncbi:helix-turn-helix domain-containing protein [Sporanaerobacter acetigenes]|uniref:Helix-turn-helix n=1 Tax=Sporanaerobacter acetigenes DSM 13106 TaxID=1123281 RepID=A0A1M5U3U8_9FIRM|nr:helix-turn-helix transcriptional regulator [Sporanaerobacter acetigenes]SHH57634.1 Helix-turn-helix [Sporanaerobacter acetigenes DSM 13106]
MQLGNRIRTLRLELKMSQTELGKRALIPQTTISDWENSKSIPNVEEIKRIAKALGVSVVELLDDKPA